MKRHELVFLTMSIAFKVDLYLMWRRNKISNSRTSANVPHCQVKQVLTHMQGRRSVFQIGGAPILGEGIKLLGYEKNFPAMPFFLLETPFCEC